jgi:hypothetical protein
MKDIQKIKEFFSKSIDEDFGQALFNRLKPKDSDLESIVNTLKQDLKIANAPDQASFKEALERYIRFNGDRDPIGQAAVRALNYRTTGDRYGNGFTRIFDMLINKKNLPEAKSNTIKKSELTNMIQEVIKEVINEYSVYQGDVSKMKPKPTPKEGEVYLKDLKPGDKFKPLKSDLEYIVVTPENGIRGVGVKHVDGTGNMNFRGDVIVKVISEQSTNKEGWLVKSNEDDTKYIVVHTSKVDNKSNRISQIYKDKKLADKRANDLNKKLRKSLTDETNESVDYDTAVAYRLITSGNREEVMAKVQGLIDNLTTGKSSKFQEVKVTMIPSKGNPNDIILKLNGPGAFSMSKDIKARPELKGVKVSTYKPQLTKI